jgi:CRP-like cAMP-binding protein
MDELDPFIEHIRKKLPFSEEELSELIASFRLKRIKKKQYIVQPEFVAKYRSYVLQGALRAYVIDEKGDDHTIQFAIEDWWITDYNSYIYQQPATMFVVALEDSIVLQIDHASEQKLKASNYKYETLFRMMAEKSAAFFARRIISGLTQNAEQRYAEFLEKYPRVAERLPQYVLASYLHMTTEFLSRIRNNKVKKKS